MGEENADRGHGPGSLAAILSTSFLQRVQRTLTVARDGAVSAVESARFNVFDMFNEDTANLKFPRALIPINLAGELLVSDVDQTMGKLVLVKLFVHYTRARLLQELRERGTVQDTVAADGLSQSRDPEEVYPRFFKAAELQRMFAQPDPMFAALLAGVKSESVQMRFVVQHLDPWLRVLRVSALAASRPPMVLSEQSLPISPTDTVPDPAREAPVAEPAGHLSHGHGAAAPDDGEEDEPSSHFPELAVRPRPAPAGAAARCGRPAAPKATAGRRCRSRSPSSTHLQGLSQPAPPQPAAPDLPAVLEAAIEQFCAFTAADTEAALHHLCAAKGDVALAIEQYLDAAPQSPGRHTQESTAVTHGGGTVDAAASDDNDGAPSGETAASSGAPADSSHVGYVPAYVPCPEAPEVNMRAVVQGIGEGPEWGNELFDFHAWPEGLPMRCRQLVHNDTTRIIWMWHAQWAGPARLAPGCFDPFIAEATGGNSFMLSAGVWGVMLRGLRDVFLPARVGAPFLTKLALAHPTSMLRISLDPSCSFRATVEFGVSPGDFDEQTWCPYFNDPHRDARAAVTSAVAHAFPALSHPVHESLLPPSCVPGLALRLYPHQRESVALMLRRELEGQRLDVNLTRPDGATLYARPDRITTEPPENPLVLRGGILADEMGLGKSVSVIALHALNPMTPAHVAAFERDRREFDRRVAVKTTLILSTPTIVDQWVQEIKRAMPDAVVRRYHGQERDVDASVWAETDFAVTTWHTAVSEKSLSMFSAVFFHRVVFDEYASVGVDTAPMSRWGAHRWLVSGTPSLCPWNCAGVFPVSFYHHREHVVSVTSSTIRHGKADVDHEVLRLAPRIFCVDVFDLSIPERVIYDILEQMRIEDFHKNPSGSLQKLKDLRTAATDVRRLGDDYLLHNIGVALSNPQFLLTGIDEVETLFYHNKFPFPESLAEQLTVMRRHPPTWSDCVVCLDAMTTPCVLACGHVFCKSCILDLMADTCSTCPLCRVDTPSASKPKYRLVRLAPTRAFAELDRGTSSRTQYAAQLISSILLEDPTAKCVVFSAHHDVLRQMEACLDAAGLLSIAIIGSASLEQRARRIATFQDRSSATAVCLLSAQANAAGISLTAANHVLLLDPVMSAEMAAQAAARVHRLGQTRPVTVHRLAARGTIEERIRRMVEAGKLQDTGTCTGVSHPPCSDEEAKRLVVEMLGLKLS